MMSKSTKKRESPVSLLELENFTAFSTLQLRPVSGLNVLIGENSTGKTHVLKTIYSALSVSQSEAFEQNLIENFLPSGRAIGRLVNRRNKPTRASIRVESGDSLSISTSFSNHVSKGRGQAKTNMKDWIESPRNAVFIPVREILSSAPGFRSLYRSREVLFEKIQIDLIDMAFLPALKGPIGEERQRLLGALESAIYGKVTSREEMFFLKSERGELEFTLLSEGLRKLALVWLLIQNGSLMNGATLFWDEPEANQNPNQMEAIASLLIRLSELGIQIFVATHNYVLLKEIELQRSQTIPTKFYSFHRADENSDIMVSDGDCISDLATNPIVESYLKLFDKEMSRALG